MFCCVLIIAHGHMIVKYYLAIIFSSLQELQFAFSLFTKAKNCCTITHYEQRVVRAVKCMRCGVETGTQKAFCQDCLASMAQNPVKPGTPVNLPDRKHIQEIHRPVRKKREIPPEEQIARLKHTVHLLAMCLAAALAAAAIFGALLFVELTAPGPHPGARNYSVTESP